MLNVKTLVQEPFADVPEVSMVTHLSDVTMTHARKGLAEPTQIVNLKALGLSADAEMAMKEIHLSHVLSTLV